MKSNKATANYSLKLRDEHEWDEIVRRLVVIWFVNDKCSLAEDRKTLSALFADAKSGGAVVIPPGEYNLESESPIELKSDTRVVAHGARFLFPKDLGTSLRRVGFAGHDLSNFSWHGGEFIGYVFDPNSAENHWEPNANTRCILVTTSSGGVTQNLQFRDIQSSRVAGAVVTVLGASKQGSNREIETFASNVTVENCSLLNSGKFMWDYGFLWQITVWPEDYETSEQEMARKYFRNDLVCDAIRMKAGDDRIWMSNTKPLKVTPPNGNGREGVCFYNDVLPSNLIRGKQYYVIESRPDYIRISEDANGAPIRFDGDAGKSAKMITNVYAAFMPLYAPLGSGPGKGAFDLVGCEDIFVSGCRLSALGDTMHIQKSRNIIFSGNQILGSRMGAFFLAEYCQNATITGNTINGTNGSRVMSVERSCEDVTIVGNTFRGGGRGSWINQPRNLILADNVFVNNTTKCEPTPRRGRRSYLTGDFERYAEVYFTTYEQDGTYGNVSIRGNLFTSGSHASHAISFAPGGTNISLTGNQFLGSVTSVDLGADCTNVVFADNFGVPDVRVPEAGVPVAGKNDR